VTPYAAAFRSAASRTIRRPGELAVRLLFYVVLLVVFVSLWKVATAAVGGTIAGYDYRALFWYVAVAEGSVIALKPRLIEDIGLDVASGAVAIEMLRPVSVLGFRFAAELGEALTRLSLTLLIGGVFAWLAVGPPHRPANLLLVVPAAILAVACNLAAQHAFAGVSFWLRDARAVWFLYLKFVFLFGGMLLPLQFLPSWLQHAAFAAPFWTMAYVPAAFAAGRFEPLLLLAQAAWFTALFGAAAAVFAAGERRLEVVGG
jgi:ABC-2 type transport system permease protein